MRLSSHVRKCPRSIEMILFFSTRVLSVVIKQKSKKNNYFLVLLSRFYLLLSTTNFSLPETELQQRLRESLKRNCNINIFESDYYFYFICSCKVNITLHTYDALIFRRKLFLNELIIKLMHKEFRN